jgi:hypothetical protein
VTKKEYEFTKDTEPKKWNQENHRAIYGEIGIGKRK